MMAVTVMYFLHDAGVAGPYMHMQSSPFGPHHWTPEAALSVTFGPHHQYFLHNWTFIMDYCLPLQTSTFGPPKKV